MLASVLLVFYFGSVPVRFCANCFLLCSSSDRSFTPTHHSYYSPKHEGMMDELLNCQVQYIVIASS